MQTTPFLVAVDNEVDPRRVRQQRRRAHIAKELSALFDERDELRGVSPVADFFAESVRWTA
jgi:hypothetical protein